MYKLIFLLLSLSVLEINAHEFNPAHLVITESNDNDLKYSASWMYPVKNIGKRAQVKFPDSCKAEYSDPFIQGKYIIENIDFLDGLLISGGDFDIDPSFYGQKIRSNKVKTIPKRTEFEMDLINLFIQSQKPILGICGGSQLINVYFNGSLIQDIETDISHEQPNPRNETSHEIILEENSYFKNLDKNVFEFHIAHNEGNYFCTNEQLKEIEDNNQIAIYYCDHDGNLDN